MRKFLFVLTIALAIGTQLFATVTATWDWQNSIPTSITSVTYQNTTGSVLSNVYGVDMFVDARNGGKLYSRNSGDAQFGAGTKLRIPVVSTNDIVEVTSYPGYHSYTVGGVAASADETVHTATVAEVTQGYVEIVATSTAYLYSVVATLAYLPPSKTIAKWDWENDNPSGIRAATQFESTTTTLDIASTIGSIMLTCVTGKFTTYGTNPHVQFNIGSIIRVPVTSTTDVVKVKQYDAGSLLFGAAETSITDILAEYTATAADVALGYVKIEQTRDSYIYSVTLEKEGYTTVSISEYEWATFSDAHNALDFTNLAGVVEAYTITGHSGTAITKGDIDATVPANTGLLLNAAEGTYAIPFASSSSTDVSLNKLVPGTGASVDAGTGVSRFVLSVADDKAVFQKIVGTEAIVPVGKAYLELPGSAPAPSIIRIVDEENGATNLESIEAFDEAVKFIQNGKLYIKKNGVVYDMLGTVVR